MAVKEKILLDKAAWSEAANSEPDALNIDEFLTFRHPEHSHVALLNTVNAVLENLDTNGDGVLSPDEFVNASSDDRADKDIPDKQRRRERRREFIQSIDLNHDGQVTRQELLVMFAQVYNDPENPLTARREARRLMLAADSNRDSRLTLQEVLDKLDLFHGSKMVDTARSFHDEF
ncbi:SDF4 [Cordylochernes scorpioides]|uniref:SDF4 n=1 Tax=Cordylochernes scorpioides TaxID=51811 RepID=A0ABY6LAP3_9ARAC|nr:SDF4 [Cordylochernes scorpioides]